MYVNKCVKCGQEFETKNPKRVICPDCLYPDKKMMINAPSEQNSSAPAEAEQPTAPQEPLNGYSTENQPQFYSSYSAGEGRPRPQPRSYSQGGYNNRQGGNYQGGGYQQRRDNQGGYNRNYNNQNRQGGNYQGGYQQRRDNRGYNQNRPQGGYNRPQGGGYNRRPQGGGYGNNRGGFNNRRPMNRNKAPKQLLISKEQLEQIALLYKTMLPLPNPDAHEVIGEKIGLEPRKVFFGINLIRQKMMLPKLPFPKRKLAISPDQLFAIKSLYEPLLPLPPIGCHKIIAVQLKMDEWRVHVGIGLIRNQMGLQRWNPERPDAPEEFRVQPTATEEKVETPEEPKAEEKPKRGRKPKKVVEETPEE